MQPPIKQLIERNTDHIGKTLSLRNIRYQGQMVPDVVFLFVKFLKGSDAKLDVTFSIRYEYNLVGRQMWYLHVSLTWPPFLQMMK
jgi:hypothetical protein